VLRLWWWRGDGLTPARALHDLANAVQAKLDRGLTSRVLQSDNDINEIKDLIGKIMSLIEVFQVSSSGVLFSTHRSIQFEGGILVEIGVEHIKISVDDINKVRTPCCSPVLS